MAEIYYHQKTQRHIKSATSFTLEDVQYPDNWLTLATEAEITNLGLVPVRMIGEQKDPLFYNNESVLDGVTLRLTATPKASSMVRTLKWNVIKEKRDFHTYSGGYKVNEKWFHSDANSRSQQLALSLQGENLPKDLQWKTMDGSFAVMTPALVRQILAASTASDQAIFKAAEAHKAAMECCENPADYDFSTGWPEVFAG